MISVDCNFPGGNIIVDSIEGETIRVHQDVRDTEGDWFWFYFRVTNHDARKFTIQFTQSKIIGVRGPAVSEDGGATWAWLGAEAVRDNCAFDYQASSADAEVRFAFGLPYTRAHLDAFLSRQSFEGSFRAGVLCTSEKGREVPLLRLGRLDGAGRYAVLLTARHHCCESTPSFVLEGLIDAVLGSPEGAYLSGHAEIMIVPFMDLDGVEAGDQGKNRKPYDHNRDYEGESLYAPVRALRQMVPEWLAGRTLIAMDLHCPWIRGPHNECIYFVGSQNETNWARVNDFSRVLENCVRGELPFKVEDNLPYGQAWNVAGNYPRKSCSRWTSELPNAVFGSALEVPYANVRGAVVTPASARAFGNDLARALAQYLKTNPVAFRKE
ncbi:MAG TPA: peptidase M14 [Planctomycetota bacterium]|nr:peptidase M14 [Planctomycetota bacterium]